MPASNYIIRWRDDAQVCVRFNIDGIVTCAGVGAINVVAGQEMIFDHDERWSFEGVTCE